MTTTTRPDHRTAAWAVWSRSGGLWHCISTYGVPDSSIGARDACRRAAEADARHRRTMAHDPDLTVALPGRETPCDSNPWHRPGTGACLRALKASERWYQELNLPSLAGRCWQAMDALHRGELPAIDAAGDPLADALRWHQQQEPALQELADAASHQQLVIDPNGCIQIQDHYDRHPYA